MAQYTEELIARAIDRDTQSVGYHTIIRYVDMGLDIQKELASGKHIAGRRASWDDILNLPKWAQPAFCYLVDACIDPSDYAAFGRDRLRTSEWAREGLIMLATIVDRQREHARNYEASGHAMFELSALLAEYEDIREDALFSSELQNHFHKFPKSEIQVLRMLSTIGLSSGGKADVQGAIQLLGREIVSRYSDEIAAAKAEQ